MLAVFAGGFWMLTVMLQRLCNGSCYTLQPSGRLLLFAEGSGCLEIFPEGFFAPEAALLELHIGHHSRGAFSHSARTAPIITVIIQVTTLKTTHLRNHAPSIQNSKTQTSDACHGSQGPKFCPL